LLAFRRLASPLTSLLRASTSALPETREGGGRGDDVAQLADAFNRMSADLRERMATITGERNRLVAILSAMVEGVVAVDREQRVLHVNEAAAAILGTPASEAMGRPAWEMTRVGEVLDALGVAARELRDLTREARIARPGGERTVQLHASPLRDGQGRPAGAVVVLHDVTELRRLETVRRDFVANVSHELKTPLTAIHGMVETVLDDEGMEAETRRRFLARVHEHSSRLGNLVHDLLALARIEAAEGALERALLDLREPVRDSAARLTPAADAKGLTLEVHLPAEPVEIEGDEEALREVVDNLLDNAVKYTPSGGAVTLTLACGATEATIDVRDTGIGIEKEHLARIFERFYRVDKARSRELGGTGLGLAIVKHLVAAHGGRVSVESEPGAGSAFRVALPRPAPADR
jgi:two-component system phosphate regulon sensor histidine kinase PhoR